MFNLRTNMFTYPYVYLYKEQQFDGPEGISNVYYYDLSDNTVIKVDGYEQAKRIYRYKQEFNPESVNTINKMMSYSTLIGFSSIIVGNLLIVLISHFLNPEIIDKGIKLELALIIPMIILLYYKRSRDMLYLKSKSKVIKMNIEEVWDCFTKGISIKKNLFKLVLMVLTFFLCSLIEQDDHEFVFSVYPVFYYLLSWLLVEFYNPINTYRLYRIYKNR